MDGKIRGSDFSRIEKAIRFLVDNVKGQPSLEDLSGYLGLSEYHCHRLFKRWTGITPKDFLQLVTLSKAKALLRGSQSVLDASHGVGLSGSSRLHDLFLRYEAMTPGEFKKGGLSEIRWGWFDSPLGLVAVAVTDKGICSLSFVESEREALRQLKASWPNARLRADVQALRPVAAEVAARMRGEKRKELRLLMRGTPFQVKVWEALLRIPEGKVTTYQELANLIGAPKSARAVGSAVGANPIGYLIPCHRVIRSSGVIGEYHWGVPRKTALLAIEHGKSSAS